MKEIVRKIGIVGVGHIGKTLARKLGAAGHDVKVANSAARQGVERDRLRFLREEGQACGEPGSHRYPAESWRQQPGAPCYCTDLTREEMPAALAAAERARLPKRRDLSVAAIYERVGDGVKNPDAEYAVRLNRALFM